jgi:glutamine amidotransferase
VNTSAVAVVDYGAGNLKSVQNALGHLKAEYFVTAKPEELSAARAMIFPGVGEAASAMAQLKKTGLDWAIRDFYRSGRPMLGICIGCQIVLERSDERGSTCLGLLEGSVRRIPSSPGLKIPHMGWNQVHFSVEHPVVRSIPNACSFYFVHSYYPAPAREQDVIGRTEYGISFPSAICRGNLIAFQFHLEKSGEAGLRLLSGFLAWKV